MRHPKKITQPEPTQEELDAITEKLIAAHPSTRVKQFHQIGFLAEISDDLEPYLNDTDNEELVDAWRAVESVRDSILGMP